MNGHFYKYLPMLKSMVMSRKKEFHHKLADFLVAETMTSGLSLILIITGIDYFSLDFAWSQIVSYFSQTTGLATTPLAHELSLIFGTLANTFPFNIVLNGDGFSNLIILGILLTAIGFMLKIAMTTSKAEFYEDMGLELIQPGIIGIITVVIMQIIMMFSLNQLVVGGNYAQMFELLAKTNAFSDGIALFGKYSIILFAGIYCVCIGSIFHSILTINKIRHPILPMISKTTLYAGTIFLAYYVFLRIIATSFVQHSFLAPLLGTFAVTSQMSNGLFMICIVMILLGREVKAYGKSLHPKSAPYRFKSAFHIPAYNELLSPRRLPKEIDPYHKPVKLPAPPGHPDHIKGRQTEQRRDPPRWHP